MKKLFLLLSILVSFSTNAVIIGQSPLLELVNVVLISKDGKNVIEIFENKVLDKCRKRLTTTGNVVACFLTYNEIQEIKKKYDIHDGMFSYNGPKYDLSFSANCLLETTTILDVGFHDSLPNPRDRVSFVSIDEEGTSISGQITSNITKNQRIQFGCAYLNSGFRPVVEIWGRS